MKTRPLTVLFLILLCFPGITADDLGNIWGKLLEEMSAAKEIKVEATTGNPEVPKLPGPIILEDAEQKLHLIEILSRVTLQDTGRIWEGQKLFTNQVFTCEYKSADGATVVIEAVGGSFKLPNDKRFITCDFFPFRAVVSALQDGGQAQRKSYFLSPNRRPARRFPAQNSLTNSVHS